MGDFDAAKALGGDPVPGMGDEAFILATDDLPTLYIRKGDRAAAISTPHYNTRSVHDAVPRYGPSGAEDRGGRRRSTHRGSFRYTVHASRSGGAILIRGVAAARTDRRVRSAERRCHATLSSGSALVTRVALATDGAVVWAAGAEQLLRIDGATNAAAYLEAPVLDDDTFLLFAYDGLWATRWSTDRLYRLVPATGTVELEVEVPRAVHPELVGDQLWVGREVRGDMVPVDRVTGALGDPVPQGAYGMGSPDSLWFARPGDQVPTITRVDPASGELYRHHRGPVAARVS